jgi:protein-tyrosine phosphatase
MRNNDPTKIELRLDPEQERMVGTAIHGNTPFDVPYISKIASNLWQGGCQNGLVLPDYIDVVFSLYPWEKYTIDRADVGRIEVEMYDSVDQGFEQVDDLAKAINLYRSAGLNVLVHCQAGLNRSSLVAARVLMLGDGATADEAIVHIRKRRSPACLCNRAFEAHLHLAEELDKIKKDK